MTPNTNYNLARDKNVLGQNWLSTYGNYFSDLENIRLFIDSVKPLLPNEPLDILYVGSASGLLGEELLKALDQGSLTLVDISKEHLNANHNPQTKKVCVDILEMNLEEKFDLIIMRSSLDYFPSKELQIKALSVIKKHLKEGGLFINQPAYISDLDNRELVSRIYNTVDKIGNRYFQSTDLESLYREVGFTSFQKIGEGKIMIITEKEQVERYDLTEAEIKTIQQIIGSEKTPYAEVTETGYTLKFEFPIFIAH